MPTYDYRCRDCGHEFEAFQSIRDEKLTECPACKGDLTRLIGSGAAILFKGSGFYETDYRSADYRAKAKADSGGSKEKAGGSKDAASPTTPSAPSTATAP